MSLDTFVFWLNFAGATTAIGLNIAAARDSITRHWRNLFTAFAILAAIYATSYMIVISGLLNIPTWSRIMRMISPAPWLIVWSGPAITRLTTHKATETALVEATAQRVNDLIGNTTP